MAGRDARPWWKGREPKTPAPFDQLKVQCVCMCEPTSLFRMCSPHCSTSFIIQTPFVSLQCLQTWPSKPKNDAHSVCNKIRLPQLSSSAFLWAPPGCWITQTIQHMFSRDTVVNKHLHHSWAGSWKNEFSLGLFKKMNFHRVEWERTLHWIGKWFGGTLMELPLGDSALCWFP